MADVAVDVFMSLGSSDELVGRLFSHRRKGSESATFAYAESWLATPGAFELEPGLPMVAGPQQTPLGRGLFGAFRDTAPDRWGQRLMQRTERRRAQVAGGAPRSFGEIDYLLGVRDDVRQGAIRLRDASGTFIADDVDGVPHLIDLGRLLGAAARLEREEADDEDLRVLLRGGSSLGGARPKAHVIDGDGRLAIAKFPSPVHDDWDVMAWEHVLHVLAGQCGIRAATSRIEVVDGRSVLIVDRFDRDATGRIAYASAMTMLEASDGEQHDYLELAEVIEEVSAQPKADLQELWRRIVFGVLVSNTDDHLRNHGFIRGVDDNGWRLSPAFDINPNPIDRGEQTTMIVAGDPTASIDLAFDVAEWFRIDAATATHVVGEVERVTSRWRETATRIGIPGAQIELMASAFDHEQRERARQVAS